MPGVTVRMNDMHGYPEWPDSPMFSEFYRSHQEYQLTGPLIRGYAARALNFEHAAVRDHYLALITELITEYDVEVLELDFLRFVAYFDRSNLEAHRKIMTEFIADVRRLLERQDRKVYFMPRIAATPGGARELGFDPQAWAEQNLVDGITVGMFLSSGWEIPVDRFRKLVGDEVAIYVSTDSIGHHWDGLPRQLISTDPELLRGFAAGYSTLGADGIELFN